MNSKDPYACLKKLCESGEDVKHLEEIAVLRRSIMKGKTRRSAADESIESSLESPAHESRDEAASASLRPLRLDGLTFFLKGDIAPSSIDTLVEIFQNRSHRRLSGFSGIGAAAGSTHANGSIHTGTVIDLGANEGFYSLAMLRENPLLRIIAAEPHPEVFEILRTNISANNGLAQQGGGITPVHSAVTERDGTAELESYPHQSTITSRNIETMGQSWIDKNRIERVRVPATTLPRLLFDHNIDHVDILKIDVEGDELAVLEGCGEIENNRETGTIKARQRHAGTGSAGNEPTGSVLNRIDKIVIEWHSDELKEECISFLTSRGFRLLYAEARRFGDLYFEREFSF